MYTTASAPAASHGSDKNNNTKSENEKRKYDRIVSNSEKRAQREEGPASRVLRIIRESASGKRSSDDNNVIDSTTTTSINDKSNDDNDIDGVVSSSGYIDWYAVFGLTEKEIEIVGREAAAGAIDDNNINNNDSSKNMRAIDVIKRQFRSLALQLHPDRCKEQHAAEAFQIVKKGYDLFTNNKNNSNNNNQIKTDDSKASLSQFHVEWLLRKSVSEAERQREELARKTKAPQVLQAFRMSSSKENDSNSNNNNTIASDTIVANNNDNSDINNVPKQSGFKRPGKRRRPAPS